MPEHDWNRMTGTERAEVMERVRRRDERRKNGPLWFFSTDLWEPDCFERERRIDELLKRAVEIAGVDYDDAIEAWIVHGVPARHLVDGVWQQVNPEKSSSGSSYFIYSQEVLDAFRALGGETEFPNQWK